MHFASDRTPWMAGLAVITAAWLVACPAAQAESRSASRTGGKPAAPAVSSSATNEATEEVDITADRMDYEGGTQLIIGRGHVVIRKGPDSMQADYVEYNSVSQAVHAKGNIVFQRADKKWEGQELTYNFKTQQGDFGEFKARIPPFYITAEDSRRVSTNEFLLENATLTTCEGDRPTVYLKARTARVTDGNTFRAKHAVFYVGGVPVFYVPYYKKYFGKDAVDIDFVPGFSSRSGAFLLTTFNLHLVRSLSTSTHLDYRTKRGLGLGQDLDWSDTNTIHKGKIKTYYLHDLKPSRNDTEEQERSALIDSTRYRIRLQHDQSLTDRDTVMADANYLSDPWILEDFFYEEYRYKVQPENYITLAHRGDSYIAGAFVNKRLNDFYDNVDRIPEFFLDINRRPIGDTPFYYEGHNLASYLERVYPETNNLESYSAFRLDSLNMAYYPTRQFGFLSLVPRAGYRGTFYSSRLNYETITNIVDTITNGMVYTTTNLVTLSHTGSGGLRNMVELGLETSFKAFKVLSEEPTGLDRDRGLRHVVEPYANYTFVPSPNLETNELPQFDYIDALDRRNDVLFGVRNKLQTKRGGKRITDLVNLDVYTTYRLDPLDGQNELSDIYGLARVGLFDSLPLEFRGQYDIYESELTLFNARGSYRASDKSEIGLEYYYRKDASDLVTGKLVLFPEDVWSFEIYERYNIKESSLDEHSYLLRRRFNCLGMGVGYRNRDGESEFWLQVWLLAIPSTIELSGGYDRL